MGGLREYRGCFEVLKEVLWLSWKIKEFEGFSKIQTFK